MNTGKTLWQRLQAGEPFPRLYAILDAASLDARGLDLIHVAKAWRDAGVQLVQYRDKISSSLAVVDNTLRLREIFASSDTLLVFNDSAAIARDAGLRAVHIGQTDGSVEVARGFVEMVGLSTHTDAQVSAGDKTSANYIAIGPVFGTTTKSDAAPNVGLEGVRSARLRTSKPLVAIGGITMATAPQVIQAGADSVAVISALLDGPDIERRARDFLTVVEGAGYLQNLVSGF